MEVKNRFTDEAVGEFDISPGVNLRKTNLANTNLANADLSGANLRWVNLSGADLSWANLYRADLSGADLTGANLKGTNLGMANLHQANLTGTSLNGVNLNGANLDGARGVVGVQFCGRKLIIQPEYTKTDCSYRPNEEWLAMSDDEAIKFGAKAEHLEFYRAQIRLGVEFLKATEAAD